MVSSQGPKNLCQRERKTPGAQNVYALPLPFGLKGIDTLGLKRLPGTRAAGGTSHAVRPKRLE